MVLAFGLDHIIVWSDRPKDPNASRYLDNTANTRGKPAIAVEAGYSGTVRPEDVQRLVNGTLSVMRYLKMLPGDRNYCRASRLDRTRLTPWKAHSPVFSIRWWSEERM